MPLPINQDGAEALANNLLSRLKSAHSAVLTAQVDNAVDSYNSIINIPSHNKALQDVITEITNSGDISRVIGQFNERLPSDVSIAEVQAFASALDSFATAIEANAALFVMSINAVTKRPEFVTPVSGAVKSIITDRITAVLAEVS